MGAGSKSANATVREPACLRRISSERRRTDAAGPALQLGVGGQGRAWFIHGRVHPRVALLEIVYRDGDVTTTEAVDGYVLYAVPARHARERHRVTAAVGRDARGKEVGRQDFRKR
jgi:hypothetical protein